VTYIIDGEPTVIEFTHGEIPYSNHGKPESFLDLASTFTCRSSTPAAAAAPARPATSSSGRGDQHLSEMQDDEADRLETPGASRRSRALAVRR